VQTLVKPYRRSSWRTKYWDLRQLRCRHDVK